MGGHHHERALAVTAVEGLVEIRLLCLGRHTRTGACPLDVYHHQRKLGHDRESESLGLQRQAGTGCGRNSQAAGEGSADGRAYSGYLVLRLHGLDTQILVYCEFLEDGSSRGYGIRTAEQRQPGFLRCGYEAPGKGLVAGYVPVYSFLVNAGSYGVGVSYRLDVGRIVETIVHHFPVGLDHLRMLLAETTLEIGVDIIERTVVDEACHTQSEHVLALVDGREVQSAVLEAFFSQPGYGSYDYVPVFDMEFLERIPLEPCLVQSLVIKGVLVHQNRRVPLQPFRIGLERRGIHGHQHVAEITGSVDLAAADMYLETRDTCHSPLGSPDLGRIIRESGKAVTVDCRQIGEQCTRELHSVSGISGEPDHDVLGINNPMLHY